MSWIISDPTWPVTLMVFIAIIWVLILDEERVKRIEKKC